jgi:adenine-specific DNA-methyltransferase
MAWSILSDIHRCVPFDSSYESRLLIEAIRLAALNQVVHYRVGKSMTDFRKDEIVFSSLSYTSERAGVSKREVVEVMSRILESSKFVVAKDIQRLTAEEFVSLLGRIHAFGSYRLPVSLQQASSQRPLGAFYTPRPVADYIVSATLGKRLKECARNCRRHGNTALKQLLTMRTVDPACGTGVFLISAFYEMQKAIMNAVSILDKTSQSSREVVELLQNARIGLYGVDMDLGAIEVADVSLRLLESSSSESLPDSRYGTTLKKGNSLISLNGFSGIANHQHFFKAPMARIPFEWQTEFREVFADEIGGFDFVVMNPPYERLKPNYAEFMREQLISGAREIHMNRYEDYKSYLQENIRYFRGSEEYRLATSYSFNTYQLFIERALHIARIGGSIGCIVPSNILSDVSAQRLRRELILRNRVNLIDDFPEASRMFPTVTQSVSIIVLARGGKTENFEFGLNNLNIKDAVGNRKQTVNREQIQQVLGQSLVIPRVDATGFALLERMHRQPSLSSADWVIIKRGELDLTLDKRYISHNATETRMIRGSHIRRFSLTEPSRAPEFVLLDSFLKSLEASGRSKHITMKRIACQQISNMGQRWRLKFAPIEAKTVLSNSCNYLVSLAPDSTGILDFLLGVLNSELLNWRFQISNSNNHVSIRELQNLPIAQSDETNEKLKAIIIKEVQKLKAGSSDFSPLLESSVFSLYGFGRDEAQEILHVRKCPKDECEGILDILSSS